MMKKFLSIGALFTVAVLIFLPFSSVVGVPHGLFERNGGNALFTIRSKMALDEDIGQVTTEYIGKYYCPIYLT